MPPMERKTLDEALERLGNEIGTLSEEVDVALRRAIRALLAGDSDLAARVVEDDESINKRRVDLERNCVVTIATQQPVGTDVRYLTGILELATELERMGDYAKDIAGVAHPNGDWLPSFEDAISEIARLDGDMLRLGTVAFLERDAEVALKVAGDRARVGLLCGALHHSLIGEPPRWGIDRTLELLSVVHDLVRFADRVVNLCERTVYVAYGEFVELDRREMIAPYEAGA